MTLDAQLFSENQAITASAPSTNVRDFGAGLGNIGDGENVHVYAQATEDFATLTSLQVSLQTSDTEGSGYADVVSGQVIAVADLQAGTVLLDVTVPKNVMKRYSRISYTVVGTAATAGKVTAGYKLVA